MSRDFEQMCGNSLSVLQAPIIAGDTDALLDVLRRHEIAVPLLLEKQFIPEDSCLQPDAIYTTPLRFCIIRNEPECLRILLEAGGNPNEIGNGGSNLLHKACKKVSIDCVKVLLEFGADIYKCDEWGVYPIHTCVATYGDFDDSRIILDLLLDAGKASDISLKDNEYEKVPFHYAAFYGNINMCKYLLQLGADINAKDKHGRTAYQSTSQKPKMQAFLKAHGCEVPPPPTKKPLPPLFPPTRQNNVSSNLSSPHVGQSAIPDPAGGTSTAIQSTGEIHTSVQSKDDQMTDIVSNSTENELLM